MTRSLGTNGLTFCADAGSPVMRTMADRMAARSTTAGTPVKSWSTTRPGVNAISVSSTLAASYCASACTSSSVTTAPSWFLSTDSSRTLIEYGRLSMSPRCLSASSWYTTRSPSRVSTVVRASNGSCTPDIGASIPAISGSFAQLNHVRGAPCDALVPGLDPHLAESERSVDLSDGVKPRRDVAKGGLVFSRAHGPFRLRAHQGDSSAKDL